MLNEQDSDSILVPARTAWPVIAAFGITLICSGLVTHFAVSIVGVVALLCAAVGWWRDVLPEQKEELVPVSAVERRGIAVPNSSLAVDHLRIGVGRHRLRIPEDFHPYSAGLYGGLAGAVAMAVVATLFGVVAQRSIWYPVNLLAAGIVPSLADAPLSRLREFSDSGLIAGSIIHLVMSLFVGVLYAISLPMFPRGAKWRSGLGNSDSLVRSRRGDTFGDQSCLECAHRVDLVRWISDCFWPDGGLGSRAEPED